VALALYEGSDGILPHVGIHGGGIETKDVVEGLCVSLRGIPNVTAFSITDCYDTARDMSKSLSQEVPSLFSKRLVECQVQLVGANKIACCIDDTPIELKDRIACGSDVGRKQGGINVEADTEKGTVPALGLVKFLYEFHVDEFV
jgi:hypothetical protein